MGRRHTIPAGEWRPAPDFIMGEQWAGMHRRSPCQQSPTHMLLLAVLESAWRDVLRYRVACRPKKGDRAVGAPGILRDVDDWVQERYAAPILFTDCCTAVGLDPDAVRRQFALALTGAPVTPCYRAVGATTYRTLVVTSR